MSFKLVLLAAGSLLIAAGAEAQTRDSMLRLEPFRMRRMPMGMMRFQGPRMTMRSGE